jgi:hypothetical protein
MPRLVIASLLVATAFGSLAAQQPTQTVTPGQTTQPGQVPPAPSTRMPPRVLRPGELPPKGTARIRGQVVAGDTGAPIRRAQVRAMSMEARGGGVTSTNTEGFFEIKDLPAGRYTIMATKGGYVSIQYGQRRPGEQGTPLELSDAQLADKVNFTMPRGGVIGGQITDDSGDPVSGTSVAALRYTFIGGTRRLVPAPSEGSNDRTDDQGMFRLYGLPPGDYIVSATNRMGMFSQADVNNTEAEAYAPTYFPGTSSLAEAVRVPLGSGQQQTGTNFSLIIARLSRIKGRALNSRGEPAARGMVMMMPADSSIAPFALGITSNAQVGADGAFQIPNVAPGRYNLSIRPMGQSSATDEFGSLSITVGSEDIDDLVITTTPGAVARGSIVTDDGSAPGFRADQVQIFANSPDPMMGMPVGNNMARVNDDYTFEFASLFERRLIRAGLPSTTGWYFKAVYHDGADVTDAGIDFTSAKSVDGLQIVLTQKTTDLSGLVIDARGKPVLDATVIVFPASRDRWARYTRTARPDTEGRYRFRSLPPDDAYFIIAVQGLQDGQAGDPDFLGRAREAAKAFSLAEGESKTVDVGLSILQP